MTIELLLYLPIRPSLTQPSIESLSRLHTWLFYTPIAANLNARENRKRFLPPFDVDTPGHFFFRQSRRCGTSTLFPGSIDERFKKSCDKIAQLD